jgi:integrase
MDTPLPISFDRLRAEVEAYYSPKRAKTRRKVRQVLRELAPLCESAGCLTAATISRWVAAHPGRSPWTRRNLLATARAICSYAQEQGWVRSPFTRSRPATWWIPADELEEPPQFPRHRTAGEIGSVLRRADIEAGTGCWDALRLRAAIYLWAYTGIGLTEALGLRVADVDLPGRTIAIRSHGRRRLKTAARAAILPVAEPLAEVLADWMPRTGCDWLFPGSRRAGPWVQAAPGYRPTDRVRQLGERAGVAGLTVLAFRHTFGTCAEEWGIGELMLQRILRHARPATQRHYRHHDADQLRRAAAKVRFDAPSPCQGEGRGGVDGPRDPACSRGEEPPVAPLRKGGVC